MGRFVCKIAACVVLSVLCATPVVAQERTDRDFRELVQDASPEELRERLQELGGRFTSEQIELLQQLLETQRGLGVGGEPPRGVARAEPQVQREEIDDTDEDDDEDED